MMEKELGQPVNVVNRTGGSGVVGHSAIAQAPADGYTLGMITVEITMMHWQGLTELGPASYTPIALVNSDPAGFTVRADSPYKSVKEVLDAIKANPGKMKASGTGQGGIWHLALAGLLDDLKIPQTAIPWVPSNGAAPAMQDLVAGGVDVVTVLAAGSAAADRRRQGEGRSPSWTTSARRCSRTCRRCSRRSASTTRSPHGAASPAPRACRPT